MRELISNSVKETEEIAQAFAKELQPGDILSFKGGMGVGKTAFTRGLAKGLGLSGEVSSPTFSLVHEYSGSIPLFHFDMYRIHTLEDLYSTGFFDYLDQNGIFAIEWSENIEGILSEEAIVIQIDIMEENSRKITIDGGGRF